MTAPDPLEELLAGLPNFARLAPADRRGLARALEVRRYRDGETIVRQGSRGDGLFLLCSGEVRVVQELHGDVRTLGVVKPGELFGVLAMIDHRPRSAGCVARGDVEAAFLERGAFELLAHQQAAIAWPFQRALAEQVAADFREAVARIRERLEPSGPAGG